MTLRRSFLRGAVNLGTGQVVVQVCSFVRSVILARLISPKDFGIAAIFAMTFSLLEMVSNLSVQSLVVQASDGDDPLFQETGQSLLVIRGIANAALLSLLAAPLSYLFGVPEARWAFYWVAAIPLLRAFCHLDVNRIQRNMQFTPQIKVDVISNVGVTLLAWPLASWLHSYAAMLWLLLVQAAIYAVGTHCVAERRYRWSFHRDYARRFFSFGWPLLINGLLMYGIFQGDRFVIGISHRLFPNSTYTLADLGVYSVAFAVTMAPSQFFVNLSSSLFLPILSRAQGEKEQFARRYVACAYLVSSAALIIAIPFIVAGRLIVPFVYGPKYAAAGAVVAWLGAMWALRVFRAAPTLAAMALGDTRNAMISNLVRTTAIVGILVVARNGGSLSSVALCGFAGEVLASIVCLGRLSVKHQLSPVLLLRPAAVCATGMALAALSTLGSLGLPTAIGTVMSLLALCAGTMLLCSPELRQYLWGMLGISERFAAGEGTAI